MAVLESNIDRFISKIEMGRDFFIDAATLLVKLIDEEPGVCERIVALKRVDWMNMDVLHTFEAIGRKQLAVEAMFLPPHVLKRLLAMPVEMQAQVAQAPAVEVVRFANSGKINVTRKPVSRLTAREAPIVLGPAGVRPVAEQAALTALPVAAERIVGCFELTVMNNRSFLKSCERVARAQKVKLDSHGQAILEVVV